jgi:ABC-type transport system involved in cytochrome bd biosynthesis fused ATPase/permease subunit
MSVVTLGFVVLLVFLFQVSNRLKEDVPDSVKEQARLMARRELEARLAELNMTSAGADGYGALLSAVQAHIAQLRDLLERAYLSYCCTPLGNAVLILARAQILLPARRNVFG